MYIKNVLYIMEKGSYPWRSVEALELKRKVVTKKGYIVRNRRNRHGQVLAGKIWRNLESEEIDSS